MAALCIAGENVCAMGSPITPIIAVLPLMDGTVLSFYGYSEKAPLLSFCLEPNHSPAFL
jgi:hypothetical protein